MSTRLVPSDRTAAEGSCLVVAYRNLLNGLHGSVKYPLDWGGCHSHPLVNNGLHQLPRFVLLLLMKDGAAPTVLRDS